MSPAARWRRALAGLRQRDFRLYCTGQAVSLTGTWMQSVAQAWLVYRLTGSGAMLGLVGAAGLLPVLLLGVAGGALADRMPRRALFTATQVAAGALAATLAALTISGAVEAWHVLAVALALGVVHAVEIPVRHALVGSLVPREALPSAVGLNSALFNLARFVGPALAGLLVSRWGEGTVFALNAVSYLAVVATVAAMRSGAGGRRPGRRPGFGALAFLGREPTARRALVVLAAGSVGGGAYTVLLPVIAGDVLAAGPGTLGLLMAAAGAGAPAAAIGVAGRRAGPGLAATARAAALGLGLGLGALALVRSAVPAALAAAFLGFCTTTLVASTNALLQVLAPDPVRGRVMALAATTFMGGLAAGQLGAGALADVTGVAPALGLAAVALLLLLAGLAVFRPRRRT